jgi:centractin
MSAEYDDVLTNQPVVIDNVRGLSLESLNTMLIASFPGLWDDQGGLCRTRPPKMFLSIIVRLQIIACRTVLLTCYDISVGRPKHIRVMAGALEGDVFIGRKAQEFRGLLKIKYPMEHGIVTDWDDMERIWSWVYAEELGTLSEEVRILKPTLQ